MTSIFHQQAEFLAAAGTEVGGANPSDILMSSKLIEEEFAELQDEWHSYVWGRPLNPNDVKECLDLMYVAAQYLNVIIGPDKAAECLNALHANNMSKCTEGVLKKRADGKVLKPVNYQPLDLSTILETGDGQDTETNH